MINKALIHCKPLVNATQNGNTFNLTNCSTFNSRDCPSYYSRYLYPSVSILVLIWIPICAVGNLVVALAIMSKKTLHTQANFLLLSVAIADLLVTCLLQPIDYMYYSNFPRYPHSVTTTIIWNAGFYALLTASVYSLTAVSLERLLAIRYPLRYKVLVTQRGLSLVFLAIWIYALATFVTVMLVQERPKAGQFDYIVPDGFYGGLISLNFLFPLTCMMIAYFYIFRVARRHRRQISFQRLRLHQSILRPTQTQEGKENGRKISHIHSHDASTSNDDREISFVNGDTENGCRGSLQTIWLQGRGDTENHRSSKDCSRNANKIYRRSFSLSRELKTARLFAVVLLCFVLFWSPFLVYQFLFVTDSILFTCPIEFGDQVVSWITYLNSGVNVFVYGAMSRDFRKAYRDLFRMILRCRKKSIDQTS